MIVNRVLRIRISYNVYNFFSFCPIFLFVPFFFFSIHRMRKAEEYNDPC